MRHSHGIVPHPINVILFLFCIFALIQCSTKSQIARKNITPNNRAVKENKMSVKVLPSKDWLDGFKKEFICDLSKLTSLQRVESQEIPVIIVRTFERPPEIVYGIKPEKPMEILYNIYRFKNGTASLYDVHSRGFFSSLTGRSDGNLMNLIFLKYINMNLYDPLLGKLTFETINLLDKETRNNIGTWFQSEIILVAPEYLPVYIGFDNLATIDRGIIKSSKNKLVRFRIYDSTYNVADLRSLEDGERFHLPVNGKWPSITILKKLDERGVMKVSGSNELRDTNDIIIGFDIANEIRLTDPEKERSGLGLQWLKDTSSIDRRITIRKIEKDKVEIISLSPNALGTLGKRYGYSEDDSVALGIMENWSEVFPNKWNERKKMNIAERDLKNMLYTILNDKIVQKYEGIYRVAANPIVEGRYSIDLPIAKLKPEIKNEAKNARIKDPEIKIIIDLFDSSYQIATSSR